MKKNNRIVTDENVGLHADLDYCADKLRTFRDEAQALLDGENCESDFIHLATRLTEISIPTIDD